MMKKILCLWLLLGYLSFASTEEVVINKHHFKIETHAYDVEDTKGKYLLFYRDEKMLFRFTLKDSTGACSAKSLIDGHYEIKENNITLYSFWNRQGEANLTPYGVRVQVYEVLNSGELKLSSALVYIEASKYKPDDESGMKYLFTSPQNEKEKKKLEAYVAEIENEYKATFVFGKEKKALFKEVKDALKRKMKGRWHR